MLSCAAFISPGKRPCGAAWMECLQIRTDQKGYLSLKCELEAADLRESLYNSYHITKQAFPRGAETGVAHCHAEMRTCN